jgi:hypothetical protein
MLTKVGSMPDNPMVCHEEELVAAATLPIATSHAVSQSAGSCSAAPSSGCDVG